MILFVGSNPSHAGPDSPAIKNLRKWIDSMGVTQYTFVNVSSQVTPGNRPLKKSEYDLFNLSIFASGPNKIVALGATASDALERIGRAHFRLPHPSPRNRVLNDEKHVASLLKACMCYLEIEDHVDCNG